MKQVVTVLIDPRFCKGCRLCVVNCPNKIIELGEKASFYGSNLPEIVDMTKCTGCGLCELFCPDFAVTLEKKEIDEDKDR